MIGETAIAYFEGYTLTVGHFYNPAFKRMVYLCKIAYYNADKPYFIPLGYVDRYAMSGNTEEKQKYIKIAENIIKSNTFDSYLLAQKMK